MSDQSPQIIQSILKYASDAGMQIDASPNPLEVPDPGLLSPPKTMDSPLYSDLLPVFVERAPTLVQAAETASSDGSMSDEDPTEEAAHISAQDPHKDRWQDSTSEDDSPGHLNLNIHDPDSTTLFIKHSMPTKPLPVRHKSSASHKIFSDSTELLNDASENENQQKGFTFDMSDDEDGSHFRINLTRVYQETPAYQPWALAKPWVYSNSPQAQDPERILSGAAIYMRCYEWLPAEGEASAQSKLPGAKPFLMRGNVPGKIPMLQHEAQWNRVMVTPHSEPLRDIRELKIHPDFLPTSKLLEHQAMEIAGWRVWRHDRNTAPCSLAGCSFITQDHNTSTQLCLGCGPCSRVRYCSRGHMLADLPAHYRQCGHASTLIPHYIDAATRPARFARRYPFITDMSGATSFEKARQRHYHSFSRGQYTLFVPGTGPQTVSWPTAAHKQLYGRRVERLMNAAFLDQRRENVVGCLFYHVRMALRLSGRWTEAAASALHVQLAREFAWDTGGAFPEDQCECVWLGDGAADDRACTAACTRARAAAGGLVWRGRGIAALLDALEARYFLLRVWQRQHPTVRDWRARMVGKGFPAAQLRDLSKERPLFGRGWDGIGSVPLCGVWESIY